VEEAVGEEVGLVDDEDGAATLLSQFGQGDVETLAEAARVEGSADVEGGEQVGEESLDGEIGIGQVGGEVEVGVEGVDEGADGGGLAGADVAGDQCREAMLEGEGEAGVEFLVGVGGEEVTRGERFIEGQAEAAKEITQLLRHRRYAPLENLWTDG